MLTCESHARLFCDDCGHQATHMDVTHYFALRMKDIYERRTAGDFTFIGLLWEYNNAMAKV